VIGHVPHYPGELYRLLAALGATAQTAADLAALRFESFPDTRIDQLRLAELVREADRLSSNVGTTVARHGGPSDRSPVVRAARAVRDVVDRTAVACDLLQVLHVEAAMEQALEQCRLLRNATSHLGEALGSLPTGQDVAQHLAAVQAADESARTVLRDALSALFEHDNISPRVILQWKEIFAELAAALTSCDDAAAAVAELVTVRR
jgi:uncharacterized protein Yka (UPF0111/DUF47 family)